MRILICDDDESIVKQLEKYIAEFFNHGKIKVPEIQSYNNGEALLSDTNNKDIVFLDIELPGVDGIFVGRELKEKNHNAIIFVITSYDEYLDDAMRFHVFRYLSKPLDKQRLFQKSCDSIRHKQNTIFPRSSMYLFLHKESKNQRIDLWQKHTVSKCNSIGFFETEQKKPRIRNEKHSACSNEISWKFPISF